MNIVIYDTEFTSWKGAQENNWGEDWQHKELVQIGAIIFDPTNMVEISSFDILVKPVKNPKLSKYLIELTGITREELAKNGVSFIEAHNKFKEYIGDFKIFSYGNDHMIIQENLDMNDIEETFNGNDILPWFRRNQIDTNKVNSGAIAKSLGIELEMHEHNALDDVRSISAGFEELIKRGSDNPFLEGGSFYSKV